MATMLDNNPRRCRGVARYAIRCHRYGQPIDTGDGFSEYWCHDHVHQRSNGIGQMFRELDTEDGREYLGLSE
jgi:hypothetical protein